MPAAISIRSASPCTRCLPVHCRSRPPIPWSGSIATSRGSRSPPCERSRRSPRAALGYHHEAPRQDRRGSLPDRRGPGGRSAAVPARNGSARAASSRSRLARATSRTDLLIPEKLYGREREIDALLAAFDRVVADGARNSCWSPAIPASANPRSSTNCTRRLSRRAASSRPASSTSTSATSPTRPWRRPFRALSARSWAKAKRSWPHWRAALREALGPNGQLIVNLIPELELIIGKQPPVPDLPPQDAQEPLPDRSSGGSSACSQRRSIRSRCSSTICNGWMQRRSTSSSIWPRTRRCGICCWSAPTGTTRSAHAHPLMRTLEAIRKAGARVEEIVLAPLGLDDVDRLVADALHCEPERARPLGAAGAREDRRQSVLRDPVLHGAGRRGAARIRPGRAVPGDGTSIASAPRATPTTSWISWRRS